MSLPFTGEKTPFDNVTLVFTVKDKMFALTNMDRFESVNLKCNPERAMELRETYSAIIPGWHMHKKHWNTIVLDGSIDDNFLIELILHSYLCVINSLPKKLQFSFDPYNTHG
jgi:predicted DNA-binding protein (MmcQ/YjbR family)